VDEQPTPKLQPGIITKETAISLSLMIAIAAGVYNFAFQQGKNEARDKSFDRMERRMETVEKNITNICLGMGSKCRMVTQ